MPSDRELYESLDSAISSLGIPTRNFVLSKMESRGVAFRPQELDLEGVDSVLIELFGVGSLAILDLARRNLGSRMVIGFDDSRMQNPVDKIKMWLEVHGNRDQTFV